MQLNGLNISLWNIPSYAGFVRRASSLLIEILLCNIIHFHPFSLYSTAIKVDLSLLNLN